MIQIDFRDTKYIEFSLILLEKSLVSIFFLKNDFEFSILVLQLAFTLLFQIPKWETQPKIRPEAKEE